MRWKPSCFKKKRYLKFKDSIKRGYISGCDPLWSMIYKQIHVWMALHPEWKQNEESIVRDFLDMHPHPEAGLLVLMPPIKTRRRIPAPTSYRVWLEIIVRRHLQKRAWNWLTIYQKRWPIKKEDRDKAAHQSQRVTIWLGALSNDGLGAEDWVEAINEYKLFSLPERPHQLVNSGSPKET
jgi:hypothetical protein